MKKSVAFIIISTLFIGVCITVAGCTGTTSPSTGTTVAASDSSAGSGTITITDGFSRTITVPVNPDRIICSGSGCLRYVVYLLGRERNVLRVRGLDALDGTPVVDIKPYSPEIDCVQ